ncbi:MAG: NAD(P)-dependent alcohol dehydrogenase [Gammaproteobacteria bacterium]
MQAVVYRCYGGAEVLNLEAVEKPAVDDDRVLVRVRAAGVNPLDWHYMRGEPYILRLVDSGLGAPNDIRMGVDFAGTVEAVGKNVKRFKPGDEVFGGATGAFGEYVSVRENGAIARKPANISFEQAAVVPVAAVTALEALRDLGEIKAGQKVLINGASGGVGTFAVQIAKSYGAEVTGVCSTRNLDMVRSIGADHVIDYTQEDFSRGSQRYDLIIDNVGNHTLGDIRRALTADGILVSVGAPSTDPWIGPLMTPLKILLLSPLVDQKLRSLMAGLRQDDLNVLGKMMEDGLLIPVIDRRYSLRETPAAIRYVESGRARGKVVVDL